MPQRLTQDEFIARAREIHGDKYDYSKVVYVNRTTKVCIICPVHGEFYQTPNGHFRYGCQKCLLEKNRNKRKLTTSLFVERAKQIHGNKYDYSKVKYISAKDKVEIICPIHGSFWQIPYSHLKGFGCQHCKNGLISKTKTKDVNTFINQAKLVHGDLYDYSLVKYTNGHSNVEIICKEHGIYTQTPNNHLRGQGCPHCQKSFGELLVKSILEKNNIKYIPQFLIRNESILCANKNLKVDFYLPIQNVIIEYNGKQHYKEIEYFGGKDAFEKQQERDMALRQYCKEHKIKLIEIPYTQFANIEEILAKGLKFDKNKV